MKIGIFTDSYLPYTSGVVKSIEVFHQEFIALGHEVFIFAPNYPNCSKEAKVFRFVSLPAPTHPGYSLAIPFSIRMKPIIKNLGLDIIHVHSPFLLGRLGARYAKKLKIPLVVTFHTLYEQYAHYVPLSQEMTKDITRKICRDFCNGCDLVITPTNIVARHVKKLGVSSNIQCIPTGIEVNKILSGNALWLRQRYHIGLEKKILLFVGRLGQEKNISFLLETYQKIRQRHQDNCLVLVGEGPEEEKLKKQPRDLGIAEHIIFTGKLPWHEVVHCYCGADIFVFSSLTETQGLVIGEAKAAGTPVVAIKAFGVGEMVEDGVDGFLTRLDQDRFVEKVLLLLQNDQLRKKMGQSAKMNAQNISSQQCAQKMLSCYEALVQKTKQQYHKNQGDFLKENMITMKDVVARALENEIKGHGFYFNMANRSTEESTKDMFHKLAMEELEHQQTFEKLLKDDLSCLTETLLEPSKQAYIISLFEDVFPSLADIQNNMDFQKPTWALSMGIQAEKNSILLYQELFHLFQDPTAKNIFSKLLEEEKLHLVELRMQMDELSYIYA